MDNKGKWIETEPVDKTTDAKLLKTPSADISVISVPDSLSSKWVAPLTAGNPVVCYQQHNSNTCLFNATSCVLPYYGNSIGAEKNDTMS
eukprot:14955701-Ditylum_brightwellii.AAC.1